jgi:uncharacterized protein (DUF433 family)
VERGDRAEVAVDLLLGGGLYHHKPLLPKDIFGACVEEETARFSYKIFGRIFMDRIAATHKLIGIGLYTPSEVSRLTAISTDKIVRWFKGYQSTKKHYDALWSPSLSSDDGKLYLSFRDMTEARVADAFISRGLSSPKVRRAIYLAQSQLGDIRPLSSAKFRTDGRTIFLQVANEEGDDDRDQLLDLFKSQFAFKKLIEPSLRDVDFEADAPTRWWISGRNKHILVDPERAFGRPIDDESSVPTSVLANAYRVEGSLAKAADAFDVSISSVRRSVEFEQRLAA